MPDSEQTYWNGEPCEAERVLVLCGDAPSFPDYWGRQFAGTTRRAVRVTYNDRTFYLDDEGYVRGDAQYQHLLDAARRLAGEDSGERFDATCQRMGIQTRQVGGPGWGWQKITLGKGSPSYGHAEVVVEAVLGPVTEEAASAS